MMNILLIVILIYVIILLLIYFKTKSLKKTLTISALIFFIFMILSILVIVIDSKNLSKLEDSTSLMVLTEKGKVISAISLNFSSEEPIFFDENELNILNIKILLKEIRLFFFLFNKIPRFCFSICSNFFSRGRLDINR